MSHPLSDERTEFRIKVRLSFTLFLGLGLSDSVPEADTIWTFREALTPGDAQLLEHVQAFPIRRWDSRVGRCVRVLCREPAEARMGRAYSQDLRDRVIDAGTSARAAAERFGIGVATAIVWTRRARETGERSARKQGQPKRSKLDPHRAFLRGLIEAEPDVTIIEMQARLVSEAGVSASVGTIWTFLDRAGLTFKKRPPTRPSRTARMS